ncbi:MutS-related protein [Roseivirga misakiensis]|uniref:DNA mismatch repair protein MutS n=1 Tax=Roseivirga misakiensis TaxID=1563681 RepID=A0A1E5T0Q6_9BACT|nr:DNA mismatch repair protein MutS [Roseivirga misakiensis]OEK04941.1 DNA mismatch repair protein MutS [Roseivirga misakiensis]
MKIYEDNIEQCDNELSEIKEQAKRYSLLRVTSFLASLILIIVLANEGMIAGLWLAAPVSIITFAYFLDRYNKLNERKNSLTHLRAVNKNELLRLSNELDAFPTGSKYLERDHAYITDLDIFGAHSLFQLLNRTTTESGNSYLAKWLTNPAKKKTILEKQKAIQELAPKLEWRQQFEVAGRPFENKESEYQKLLNWFKTPEKLLPNKIIYFVGAFALGVIATTLTILCIIHIASDDIKYYSPLLFIVLLINFFILKKLTPLAEEIIDSTHNNVQTLGGYQMLAAAILSEKFNSKKLIKLQTNLYQNDRSATDEIKQLRKILEVFQLRGTKRSDNNKFYGLFNVAWLFDVYLIILVEKWKKRNRDHIRPWFEAISEFEALNSLAGFTYSNPGYEFPEIKEEPYHLSFSSIGHPLIKASNRVCNDFSLNERGQIAMITGSNMAGKSTFLRTIGINLTLALMGAPCCAKTPKVSEMIMFTSMRTQDNLIEGVSSFYAELKRVEQLLEQIESGRPIFFMLDEMFKGTNSEDRYKGGVSLIKQLNELNAFGIISTHDLELANLAGKHLIVANHSFNSKIKKGELEFDYKLTDGICTDFNASELMKKSGIKILNDIEKLK